MIIVPRHQDVSMLSHALSIAWPCQHLVLLGSVIIPSANSMLLTADQILNVCQQDSVIAFCLYIDKFAQQSSLTMLHMRPRKNSCDTGKSGMQWYEAADDALCTFAD